MTSISPEITERIIQGQYDLLLFSSPSCLASFKAHLHGRVNLGTLKTACLGPTTEEALLAEGITPLVVAQPSSADGLITAIKKYYKLPLAAQTVSLSK